MKRRFLESHPLFAGLSDAERRALGERFELCHFAEGQVLVEQGQPAEAMFLIRSGQVRLLLEESSRLQVVFGPSDLVGEMELLLERPPARARGRWGRSRRGGWAAWRWTRCFARTRRWGPSSAR